MTENVLRNRDDLIPPVNYEDPAVHEIIDEDPAVHEIIDLASGDSACIVDYLVAETSLRTAAEEYGIDRGLGELASTDPEIAWNDVSYFRQSNPALLERADERLHEHDTTQTIATIDDYMCALARTIYELTGEDAVYAAAMKLWKAIDNNKLPVVEKTR